QRLLGPFTYRSQPGDVRNSQGGEKVMIPDPNWLLIAGRWLGATSTVKPAGEREPSQVARTSIGQRTCPPHWLAATIGRHLQACGSSAIQGRLVGEGRSDHPSPQPCSRIRSALKVSGGLAASGPVGGGSP